MGGSFIHNDIPCDVASRYLTDGEDKAWERRRSDTGDMMKCVFCAGTEIRKRTTMHSWFGLIVPALFCGGLCSPDKLLLVFDLTPRLILLPSFIFSAKWSRQPRTVKSTLVWSACIFNFCSPSFQICVFLLRLLFLRLLFMLVIFQDSSWKNYVHVLWLITLRFKSI